MKQVIYTVKSNDKIADGVYRMSLAGDTSALIAPGQFINIRLSGFYLRRPISVCDYDSDGMVIIYKVVGGGTKAMSELLPGAQLDTLSGLGNGFDSSKSGDKPLLVGGGVGVPPMYGLCRRLAAEGKKPTVVLGFNSYGDVFYEQEFKELGADVRVATADGSYGAKGFVTDVIGGLDYSFFYACGPEPMFRAMSRVMKTGGQYSFEERMGCGFGACMGCSCKTLAGNKRICREGPVMNSEEIIWDRK